MSVALIDDQLLGQVLRGKVPKALASKQLYTTGHWYVRLCQAVLGAHDRSGKLSGPFSELPSDLRYSAVNALLELPEEIGLLSLRALGPEIAQLRHNHRLNILSIEALAAASHLHAQVFLSVPSPMLEEALQSMNLKVKLLTGR
jgi:hypothetical protein